MINETTDVLDREAVGTAGRVLPLSELDEFEVADGYPEIRGWDVRDSSGRSIGYVYDLLVDVEVLCVRYLDVELDAEFTGVDADRRVLIPLESVGLDGGGDDVLLRDIDAADVHALVPYARRGVSREREALVAAAPVATGVTSSLGTDVTADPAALVADATVTAARAGETDTNFYGERHYDDARLFSQGDVAPAIEPLAASVAAESVIRSGAAPTLGDWEAELGDVGVRKTVETERVRERVPITREDVEIERRALQPGEELLAPDVRGDEIRIPIMVEELVVEKRLVAKEVLIIRKRTVTEERVVEADLRRERVEVDDPGRRVPGVDSSPGGAGLA